MNGNPENEYMNTSELWHKGIKALTNELGPVGMARFIREFSVGYGNYTDERNELLSGVTNEGLKKELGL